MNASNHHFGDTQFLTFTLAGEEYAVGILKVKEIIPYGPVTTVPQTPAAVRGVLNLRGSVVPVIDLACKLDLPSSAVNDRTCIVIVEVELGATQTVMGVIADSVSQVVDLYPDDIIPPPPFGTRVRIDFLRGMAKNDNKFILVLDIDNVLASLERNVPPSAVQSESPMVTE